MTSDKTLRPFIPPLLAFTSFMHANSVEFHFVGGLEVDF